MAKVRFIDNLKVGAYSVIPNDSPYDGVINNIDNYILTATGGDKIQGEENLIFSGSNLGIGTISPLARFEIKDNNTGKDLILIRNLENKGILINSEGVLKLIEFDSLPNIVDGGFIYSSGSFWVGL